MGNVKIVYYIPSQECREYLPRIAYGFLDKLYENSENSFELFAPEGLDSVMRELRKDHRTDVALFHIGKSGEGELNRIISCREIFNGLMVAEASDFPMDGESLGNTFDAINRQPICYANMRPSGDFRDFLRDKRLL